MLIRFAERGLVLNGRPNLQLFNQLFWTIFVSYCVIGICMAPPYSLFSTKSFNYAFGTKVCLARSIADHDVLRRNFVSLFLTATLGWVIVILLKARTKQYLQGICPDGKMSSIGNFRRNFITFDQTTKYIHITVYFFTFHRGIVFSLFQAFSLHPDANRMISNAIGFYRVS